MPHVAGLDHAQIAIPPGADDAARAFYGGVLGLPHWDAASRRIIADTATESSA